MLTMKGENMEELTTAESMVMKTIWDHPHEMALQEIMKLTNETYGKDWKPQTVSTYIAKLVKKGFLRMNQSGRNATYEIIIPELSYQQEQSRKFVKFWNPCQNVAYKLLSYERLLYNSDQSYGLILPAAT